MAYKIKQKKSKSFWNKEEEINKENYKIFLKNNKMTSDDYPFGQYLDDMIKERAKDPENFNARF